MKRSLPTAECGVSSKDPVGATHPPPPSQTTGNKGLSCLTTVTLSNGVTKSAIFNGNGLTVTAASPTSIMIANSNSAVTMNGKSVFCTAPFPYKPARLQLSSIKWRRHSSIKPKEVVLTGDSIKTSGSDTIAIPKGAVVVRDHRDGKDPGVAIVKNDDGTYSAKATDENKGIIAQPAAQFGTSLSPSLPVSQNRHRLRPLSRSDSTSLPMIYFGDPGPARTCRARTITVGAPGMQRKMRAGTTSSSSGVSLKYFACSISAYLSVIPAI